MFSFLAVDPNATFEVVETTGPNALNKNVGEFLQVGDDDVTPNAFSNANLPADIQRSGDTIGSGVEIGTSNEANPAYVGSPANENRYDFVLPYNPSLAGAWNLTFTDSIVSYYLPTGGIGIGQQSATVTTQSVAGIAPPPDPTSVTTTTNPDGSEAITWNWSGVNGVFVNVFDITTDADTHVYSTADITNSINIQGLGEAYGFDPTQAYEIELTGAVTRPATSLSDYNSEAWNNVFYRMSYDTQSSQWTLTPETSVLSSTPTEIANNTDFYLDAVNVNNSAPNVVQDETSTQAVVSQASLLTPVQAAFLAAENFGAAVRTAANQIAAGQTPATAEIDNLGNPAMSNLDATMETNQGYAEGFAFLAGLGQGGVFTPNDAAIQQFLTTQLTQVGASATGVYQALNNSAGLFLSDPSGTADAISKAMAAVTG